MRKLSVALAVMFAVGVSGMAFAQSKCDSKLTKAVGKKMACKAGVYSKGQAKGTAPDPAKLQKCEDKFAKACTKAQAAGDCSVQQGSCAALEATADACALEAASSSSPSGAFLE
jgi:hypothetical protein